MTAIKRPMDPGPAAWNSILSKRLPSAALSGQHTADIVIIGAGFAGLSAARRLMELDCNLHVVLVEAREIAEGPAGRNSGFMIDLPHNLASKDYAGALREDELKTAMNRHAIAFAAKAAEAYEMEREAFDPCGKINAAATDKGDRHNQDYARHLANLGESHEFLDAIQMRDLTGSSYYHSGLYTPGTAMLQPALYVRRFADGLIKQGVQLYENTPITGLEKIANGWRVTAPSGFLDANKVIMATNGHVESFGYFKRRLMHVYLYASMSEPFNPEQLSKMGGAEKWGLTPSDPMGTTVRKISGQGGTRLVIRNSISWAPNRETPDDKAEQFRAAHQRALDNRFPALAGTKMAYRWGGLLCLSRNAVSAFGALDDNLYAACCQNGLGTAMGTLSGIAAAEISMDQPTKAVRFFEKQAAPTKLPREPFSTLGANLYFKWGQIKAGREI